MAADQQTGTHTGTIGPQTVIVDTVLYSNLLPGKEYSVFGKLMLQSTGEPFLMSGKEVTAETTFIAENTSGSVELSFTCLLYTSKSCFTPWNNHNSREQSSGRVFVERYCICNEYNTAKWLSNYNESVSYTHLDVYKRQERRN